MSNEVSRDVDLTKDYADVSDPEGEPCAVWERVSTTMTRQDIAAQTRDLKAHIASNSFRVTKVFRFAVSAFHGEHSSQQDEMIADVQAGLYKVVVSAMSSRYERRGAKHALRLALDLDLYGGRMVAIDDPNYGDMNSELGIVGTVLKAKSDHDYSKAVSENINRHFRLMEDANAFRGTIPGGYAVTGAKKEKKLVKHPYAADIVTQAFLDCARGKTSAQIARTFKAANDRYNATLPEGATRLRLPTAQFSVCRLLRSPVYSSGRYVVIRRDGSGTYEYKGTALVTPAQQRAAIEGLERRGSGGIASRAIRKEDYSGAILCAEHGVRGHRCFSGGKLRADGTPGPRQRRYIFRLCCGKTVNADATDVEIDKQMSRNPVPWWVPVTADPNAERDRELALVERDLRDLPSLNLDEDEEDERRAELRAERKRLQAIPDQEITTYAKVMTNEAGKPLTEGDRWRMLTPPERRDLLIGRYLVLVKATGDNTGRVIVKIVEPSDDEDDD